MRALLLLGFLIAASASAQVGQPDTTDWRSYYPLEVGNEWQYHYTGFGLPDADYRNRIVADTLIGDVSYFIMERCSDDFFVGLECRINYLRYNEERAGISGWSPTVGAYDDWGFPPCRFDAPFQTEINTKTCTVGPNGMILADGFYESSTSVGSTAFTGTEKWFDSLFGWIRYLSGVGMFEWWGEGDNGDVELVFLRLDGVSYGTPVLTVGTEAAVPGRPSGVEVSPNPVRDTATLRFTLDTPQDVTLEVFSVLGRRIRVEPLGALGVGEQVIRFEPGGLPSGAYRLRLTGVDGFGGSRGIIVHR